MRDRDRWGHHYDDDYDERYDSRDDRSRPSSYEESYEGERAGRRSYRPDAGPREERYEESPGPLRGSRYMYEVDDEERFYEGDYPRADMGGPYRYGAGRRGRGPERPRRRGRYPSIGDYTGVGSAEGYTGFGGPGWQSGGYGDPGFQTSSTQRRHHRADHSIGTDLPRDDIGLDRSTSWTGKGRREESGYRRAFAGEYASDTGPYAGRGPKDYRRSEERIHEDVCERLTRHGAIDASRVEIEVNDGDVTLRGTVNGRRAKRLAEDVVETVPGVREVYNNLRSEERS